jgi:phage gp36-like protein
MLFKPLSALVFLLPLLAPTQAAAEEADDAPPPAPELSDRAKGLLEQAGTEADKLWQQSRNGAADIWQQSRDTAGDWWQRSRDATLNAWDDAGRALTPEEVDPFREMWTEVVPTLEETLQIEDSKQQLPDRAWLGRDKRDADDDINALLDEAVAILSTSSVQRYRERIRELQQAIEQARAEIDDYRKQRIAAPRESVVNRTVADYDRLIEERMGDIRGYRDELSTIRRQFAGELRQMGLELSDEQVELLLSTVVGDNIVDLGIVFDNVKAITRQLEQLVRDSGEDLQSARRYYGMYVVLLRALERMHRDVEQQIAERYIPQIDAIAERARDLSDETRELQQSQPEKADILAANLEAQQLTIRAAAVYRDYLSDQAEQVRAAREALDADIQTAWNTYETVRISGELVDLVQASQRLLDGLLDRQVPALRPFENLAMKRELEKLTAQLRER